MNLLCRAEVQLALILFTLTVNTTCYLCVDMHALPQPSFSDNLIYENRREVKHVVSHPIQHEVTFQPITLMLKRGTVHLDILCRTQLHHHHLSVRKPKIWNTELKTWTNKTHQVQTSSYSWL